VSIFTDDEVRVLKEFAHTALAREQFNRQLAADRKAACERGAHDWIRNDIRALVPYCNRCGKEER
jgi:hypothetical protein